MIKDDLLLSLIPELIKDETCHLAGVEAARHLFIDLGYQGSEVIALCVKPS